MAVALAVGDDDVEDVADVLDAVGMLCDTSAYVAEVVMQPDAEALDPETQALNDADV